MAYRIVLQEFTPCLGKHYPFKCKSVYVHPRGSVGSTDTQVCPFFSPVLFVLFNVRADTVALPSYPVY